MTGLTEMGLIARIKKHDLRLTEAEAIDVFFFYPSLVDIHRDKKGNSTRLIISGLNLEFSIKD